MSFSKSVIAAGLVAGVLIAGLAREASAAPQTSTSAGVKVDDSTLQSRIDRSIEENATLAPRDIDVDVTQGVVTLTGKVRSATEKARAGELALVTGVTRVDNRIEIDPKIDQSKIDAASDKTKAGLSKAVDATVKAAQTTKKAVQKGVGKTEEGAAKAADKTSEAVGKAGDKLSDAAVTTRIKTGFSGEKLLQDSAIDVDTTDHIVTLRGTVPSSLAKARAVEIARGTESVTGVVDRLVVRQD